MSALILDLDSMHLSVGADMPEQETFGDFEDTLARHSVCCDGCLTPISGEAVVYVDGGFYHDGCARFEERGDH